MLYEKNYIFIFINLDLKFSIIFHYKCGQETRMLLMITLC